MAVDAAVMVIDSAKGIEAQTKKLFEVVKHRNIPVFTFMNKLDRDGREPLDLLEELETRKNACSVYWGWTQSLQFVSLSDFKGNFIDIGE